MHKNHFNVWMRIGNIYLMLLLFVFFKNSLSVSNDEKAQVFFITDFGARSDGETLCTEAIQSAIDACYQSGGGTVIIPGGTFLTGTIQLKDNVFLKLEPNAVILGSQKLSDYKPLFLIFAKGASNIGIIGTGTINGNGDTFWRGKKRPFQRPERLIEFEECQDVYIRDVKIRNSPMFNISLVRCDRVYIHNISIVNDQDAPNTDGIDPISSSNVFISDCYIETGDDAICPKASYKDKPVENLVVTNCVLISDDSAIKFGTGSTGIIRNCAFSNIVIRNTKYGITFFMKDGGVFENLQFSNISIETFDENHVPKDRNSNTYPIFMDIEKRTPDVSFGKIRNITFSNIQMTTYDGNCVFLGMPEQKIENVSLNNVQLRVLVRNDISKRRKPRGTRKLKNIAPNDYSNVFSHFTFAHISGLSIRNLTIQDASEEKAYERHSIWGKNLSDVEIVGFKNRQRVHNTKLSIIELLDCFNVDLLGCRPEGADVPFVRLSGQKTDQIKLIGNDLSGLKNVFVIDNDVKQGAIFQMANYF